MYKIENPSFQQTMDQQVLNSQYYYKCYLNYYQEGYSTTGRRVRSLKEAFKEAQKTMDKKMKLLNPNKASLVGKKGISRKRTNQFRQWLLDKGNSPEPEVVLIHFNSEVATVPVNL